MIFIAQSLGEGNNIYNVLLSLVISTISFLIALYNFLTIRPSIVTQADFDDLAQDKQHRLKYFLTNCYKKYDAAVIKSLNSISVKDWEKDM